MSLVLSNTAAMLDDLGHEVIEATSGEQALRVLHRLGAVDLLITDKMMPGIRGTQLIEAVRSEWPDLRVILATGYAETRSKNDDVPRLNKPFMQQDLARAIAFIARQQDEAGRVVQFRRGERSREGARRIERNKRGPIMRCLPDTAFATTATRW